MNRHPGPLALATLSGILLILTASAATVAHAQAIGAGGGGGAASLGEQIKTSTDFAAITAAVDAFLAAQVPSLTNTDPAVRSAAREALVEGAAGRGNVAPSPTFLDVYARGVNDKLGPALTHENDLIRLNGAIVVAKVAERADNVNLRGAVLTLLKDKSPTVGLWALKAARYVVVPVIRNPGFVGDQVLNGIVATAKEHGTGPLGGAISIEAYDALSLDVANPQANRRPNDKMISTVVPFLHQILQERVAAYRSAIPPEPLAERIPTTFLTHARVWPVQTPEQKLASIQVMSDLIALASQHMGAATPLNREKLALIITHVGQAMTVVPEIGGAADIKAKLDAVAKVGPATPPQEVATAVGAVFAALKSHKGFAQLNPPPAIAAAAAGAGGDEEIVEATQPTTGPATTRAALPATQPRPAVPAPPAKAAPSPAGKAPPPAGKAPSPGGSAPAPGGAAPTPAPPAR